MHIGIESGLFHLFASDAAAKHHEEFTNMYFLLLGQADSRLSIPFLTLSLLSLLLQSLLQRQLLPLFFFLFRSWCSLGQNAIDFVILVKDGNFVAIRLRDITISLSLSKRLNLFFYLEELTCFIHEI